MHYFLDTEFNEGPESVELISLAVTSEDERDFYAISAEADLSRAGEWLQANVISKLPPRSDPRWMARSEIARGVEALVGEDEAPKFWAYYGAYDWVAFCQVFGGLLHLPKRFPKWYHELKMLDALAGNPAKLTKPGGRHDALVDTRWNRELFLYLCNVIRDRGDPLLLDRP